MSASSTPMRKPLALSPSARLAATVDLPTPPLPEATAMIAPTPGTSPRAVRATAGPAGRGAAGRRRGGEHRRYRGHFGQRLHRLFSGLAQRLELRAALVVDLDCEGDIAVANRQAGDNAEGHDIRPLLRVSDMPQRIEDLSLGDGHLILRAWRGGTTPVVRSWR